MKTFFILWFMIGPNTHTLNLVKLETEAECKAAAEALVKAYNEDNWVDIGMDSTKCIEVKGND